MAWHDMTIASRNRVDRFGQAIATASFADKFLLVKVTTSCQWELD